MSSWMPPEDITPENDGIDISITSRGGGSQHIQKSAGAMHMEIVEYLKTIEPPLQATFTDLQRELGIDLGDAHNAAVLDLLLCNRTVEVERRRDNDLSAGAVATDANNRIMFLFRYRAKHDVKDRWSLLREVERVATGVALSDLCSPLCYPNVVEDVETMILRGEVIAYSNKEFQLVLYPRGTPFLVQLSGEVSAIAGQQVVSTTADISQEIRRGDAVRIGSHGWDWYRVSCTGAASQQLLRQKAPCSVTSDRDIDTQGKNIYRHDFTRIQMPLDGEYDAANATELITRANIDGDTTNMHGIVSDAVVSGVKRTCVTTKVYRHGVTNDIRELWASTADSLQAFKDMDDSAAFRLRETLARHKLISSGEVRLIATTGQSGRINKNKRTEKDEKKRKRRVNTQASAFNTHLKGGALEAALLEDHLE